MSDQTPEKPGRQKTGIIAVVIIVIAAVLCVLLFFAAKNGIVDIPFIKQDTAIESDSSLKDSADGSTADDGAEVIDQPVEKLTDFTSLAGNISKSAGKASDSESTDNTDASSSSSESNGDYIFPDSSDKSISKSDIENLSDENLRIAINEIYARHGYVFSSSAEMRDYFNSKDWYEPDEDVDDMTKVPLTKTEKKNIDKMVDERNKRKDAGTWPY